MTQKDSAYRSISASISLSRLALVYPDLQLPLLLQLGQALPQLIAVGQKISHCQLGLLH
jgi:hypothetical protein